MFRTVFCICTTFFCFKLLCYSNDSLSQFCAWNYSEPISFSVHKWWLNDLLIFMFVHAFRLLFKKNLRFIFWSYDIAIQAEKFVHKSFLRRFLMDFKRIKSYNKYAFQDFFFNNKILLKNILKIFKIWNLKNTSRHSLFT